LIRIGLEAVFAKAARENGPLMKMGGLRFMGDIHRNELIKNMGCQDGKMQITLVD
jgi:hypothetical protein